MQTVSEVDNFTETVCHFFDDGDPILKNYTEYKITENQKFLLEEFREKFQSFSEDHDYPEEFIDTPEWESIMNKAKEILKAFEFDKP